MCFILNKENISFIAFGPTPLLKADNTYMQFIRKYPAFDLFKVVKSTLSFYELGLIYISFYNIIVSLHILHL